MTNLQYLRSLINDKNSSEYIFTDDELNELIHDYTVFKTVRCNQVDSKGKVFELPKYKRIDENYEAKLYDKDGNELAGTIDKVSGEITFSTTQTNGVFFEGKVIIWQNVRAKCLEIIATDIRKWNSYSIGGMSETFSKTDLMNLAQSLYEKEVIGSDI